MLSVTPQSGVYHIVSSRAWYYYCWEHLIFISNICIWIFCPSWTASSIGIHVSLWFFSNQLDLGCHNHSKPSSWILSISRSVSLWPPKEWAIQVSTAGWFTRRVALSRHSCEFMQVVNFDLIFKSIERTSQCMTLVILSLWKFHWPTGILAGLKNNAVMGVFLSPVMGICEELSTWCPSSISSPVKTPISEILSYPCIQDIHVWGDFFAGHRPVHETVPSRALHGNLRLTNEPVPALRCRENASRALRTAS